MAIDSIFRSVPFQKPLLCPRHPSAGCFQLGESSRHRRDGHLAGSLNGNLNSILCLQEMIILLQELLDLVRESQKLCPLLLIKRDGETSQSVH